MALNNFDPRNKKIQKNRVKIITRYDLQKMNHCALSNQAQLYTMSCMYNHHFFMLFEKSLFKSATQNCSPFWIMQILSPTSLAMMFFWESIYDDVGIYHQLLNGRKKIIQNYLKYVSWEFLKTLKHIYLPSA